MKIKNVIFFLFLSITSCQTDKQKGYFLIKSEGKSTKATEVIIYDEENRAIYICLDGKKGEVNGSFEIYDLKN